MMMNHDGDGDGNGDDDDDNHEHDDLLFRYVSQPLEEALVSTPHHSASASAVAGEASAAPGPKASHRVALGFGA